MTHQVQVQDFRIDWARGSIGHEDRLGTRIYSGEQGYIKGRVKLGSELGYLRLREATGASPGTAGFIEITCRLLLLFIIR